jgi:hypothetical protein
MRGIKYLIIGIFFINCIKGDDSDAKENIPFEKKSSQDSECMKIIKDIKNNKYTRAIIGEWFRGRGVVFIIDSSYNVETEMRNVDLTETPVFPRGKFYIKENEIGFIGVPIEGKLPVENVVANKIGCKTYSNYKQISIVFYMNDLVLLSLAQNRKAATDFCIEYDFGTKQEKLCELPKLNL